MKPFTKLFVKSAGTLAAAAHLAAACLPAHAQVLPNIISNTAQAEWTSGGQTLSRPSNNVDIVVDRSNPPQPTALEVFHFANSGANTSFNVPQTMCRASSGLQPVNLQGAFAGFSTNPASLSATSSIRAGEPIVLRVTSPARNLDPAAIDSFEAEIVTDAGDREHIFLTETAANSSIFVALVNTSAIPPAPVHGDCVLSVRPGDQIRVELDETLGGGLIASTEISILVDPFGLTFDSADGSSVNGTRITIVDATTGAPADVFGDDGVSIFPNTIVTGSQVRDSGGQIYDFSAGFYRFPFLRPGNYRLIVTPPAPYTHPSVATPGEISLLTRPDGGQFVIAPGSYGGIITLSDPAPVRIDIPMDRPGGSLQLRKTTSAATAMPGDVVQYRIEVRNPDRTRISGPVTVTDILPNSMRLRLNSVRYNGSPVTANATAAA